MSRRRDANSEYWDAFASAYDTTYSSAWSAREDEELTAFIGQCLNGPRNELSVLDIGAGTGFGYHALQSLRLKLDYVGLDYSSNMLSSLRQKYPDATTICSSVVDTLKWPCRGFDVVLALNGAFSFCLRPRKVLRRIATSLREKESIAIIGVLNEGSLRRWTHLRCGGLEKYASRGRARRLGTVPALVYRRNKFESLAQAVGLRVIGRLHQGLLSGVTEVVWLWRMSQALGQYAPALSHCSYYCCARLDGGEDVLSP